MRQSDLPKDAQTKQTKQCAKRTFRPVGILTSSLFVFVYQINSHLIELGFYRWRWRDRCRHRLDLPRRPAQSRRLRWRQRQPSRFGGADNDIRHFEKSIFKSPAQKIEFLSTGGNACGMTVISILVPYCIRILHLCRNCFSWFQIFFYGLGGFILAMIDPKLV